MTGLTPQWQEGLNASMVFGASADALQPESLAPVMADVDVAYYLVHSMAAGADFGELDLEAAGNFRDAAARAGIRSIIYLGGLIPKNPESVHLQSRFETGEVLRQGVVPVTEVRAGMIIGPGSAAFEVMRDLVNNLPLMITPRWVFSRSPPIALPDLLSYLVAVAALPQAAGQTYDAAGPEVLTYAEIMRRLANILGRKIIIIPVPVLTPKLSSYWLRLVTSVPVNIARALIDGLKHDVLANNEALRQLVPMRLHNLEEAIGAALQAERNHAIPAHWVEGSIRCRNFEPRYGGLCYGVDGCKGGWIYACIGGKQVQFGTVRKLIDLVNKVSPKSPIFVDIPIGLHDSSEEGRKCDVEGRRLLRPYRTSSVFNAPIRAILDEPRYEAANALSKRLSGKGLTKQTFNIIPKIREVDQLMASSGKARELVREVHPEVCFCGLAGGRPMEFSKKTKEGFQARLDILIEYQPGVEQVIERALSHYPRSVVAADDILDALVCAVTARMSDRWRTVPERPDKDSRGLPMEMVYCLP